MKIATIFWFCIGALVLGYLATVALNSVLSRRNEALLERTAAVVFPAAQRAQAAQADFRRQLLAYLDAVVVGDADALSKADAIATEVRLPLEELSGSEGISLVRRQQIRALADDLVAHAERAREVYGPIANGDTDEALLAKAAAMNSAGEALLGRLQDLSQDLSDDLRGIIADTVSATVRQRGASEIAFVVIVIGTLAVIVVIIARWARRLDELVYASGRLAEGDYEGEIVRGGSDEVGRLAESFARMRAAVQRRDRELRMFNETLEAQVRERTEELRQRTTDRERLMAERESAQQSLHLLDHALAQIPEAVVIATAEETPQQQHIAFANAGFSVLMGVKREESCQFTLAALCHPVSSGLAMQQLVSEVRAGRPHATIIEADLPNGVQRLDIHAAPIRDDGGAVMNIAYIITPLGEDSPELGKLSGHESGTAQPS
jgi:HAMP domain-containing protein